MPIDYKTESVYHKPAYKAGAQWVEGVGWVDTVDTYATEAVFTREAESFLPHFDMPGAQVPYGDAELYGDAGPPPPYGTDEWYAWLEQVRTSGGVVTGPDGTRVTVETPGQAAAKDKQKSNSGLLLIGVAALGALLLLRGR